MLHQEVVEEGGDVEEDGLGVEEEFGEEGEVLGVQLGGYELVCVVPSSLLRKCSYLVLLPINLVNRIAIFLVNNLSYRRIAICVSMSSYDQPGAAAMYGRKENAPSRYDQFG